MSNRTHGWWSEDQKSVVHRALLELRVAAGAGPRTRRGRRRSRCPQVAVAVSQASVALDRADLLAAPGDVRDVRREHVRRVAADHAFGVRRLGAPGSGRSAQKAGARPARPTAIASGPSCPPSRHQCLLSLQSGAPPWRTRWDAGEAMDGPERAETAADPVVCTPGGSFSTPPRGWLRSPPEGRGATPVRGRSLHARAPHVGCLGGGRRMNG